MLYQIKLQKKSKFVYDIASIVEQDEEEDIEYVMSDNPQQQKKLKNKQKKIKTINPTEQDEQNNIPLFLCFNKKNIQHIQQSNKKIKNKQINARKNQPRQKSQSFMIPKHEFKNSIDINQKEATDLSQMQEKQNEINNKWKKLAYDTNQKFKKLIDVPQIQKFQKQLSSHIQKKLFMAPNISPKNQKGSKSNNVSFVGGHFEATTSKKAEQSILENNNIQMNIPNMNDQTNPACVICFDNVPDSVYMPCGHGGVCYECSVDIMRNTGECYLCRDAIKEILRLDVQDKVQNNNYKVIALTTMVDESVLVDNNKNKNDQLNNINEIDEDDQQNIHLS